MAEYVLGFAFDSLNWGVLLIEKKRPAFQAGKLNGIGGKVEQGESMVAAMVREFREETGICELTEDNWTHYATMMFDDDAVHVFKSSILPEERLQMAVSDPPTDEKLFLCDVDDVVMGGANAMTNLQWLVPMAFDPGYKQPLIIQYGERNG